MHDVTGLCKKGKLNEYLTDRSAVAAIQSYMFNKPMHFK